MKQEVPEELGRRGALAADGADHETYQRRQQHILARREIAQLPRGADHEQFDRPQPIGRRLARWEAGEGAVHPLESLRIGLERVQEDRAEQQADHLRHARVRAVRGLAGSRADPRRPNRHDGARAEVQRRRERGEVTHAAVAVELVAHADRGEDDRQRRRRHHVLDREAIAYGDPLGALPNRHLVGCVHERHGARGRVRRRAQSHSPQPPRGDVEVDPAEVHALPEELAQRLGVHEPTQGWFAVAPSDHPVPHQPHRRPSQVGWTDAIDPVGGKAGPLRAEELDRVWERSQLRGEVARVDGAGGHARQDGELKPRQTLRESCKHAYLVGGVGPAT